MRALIQRVSGSCVTVHGEIKGNIEKGVTILLGVQEGDSEVEASFLAKKIVELRIFPDENDKMNLSLLDTNGSALVISQFTLYADCKKGRRPSFVRSGKPEEAEKLYHRFVDDLRKTGIEKVETGLFGSLMELTIHNHGPVTIMLDTDELLKKGNRE